MCRVAALSYLQTGEILAISHFRKTSDGGFRTSVQIIDSNRLVTPTDLQPDDATEIRGGVRINKFTGEPIEYFIAKSNPLEGSSVGRGGYDVVPARIKSSGRRLVIHIIDALGVEQSRSLSPVAPALENARSTQKLNEQTMKSALFQNTMTATVTSNANYEAIMGAVGGMRESGNSYTDSLAAYQANALSYHEQMKLNVGDGIQIAHLLPGEDLEYKHSGVVSKDYESFSNTM